LDGEGDARVLVKEFLVDPITSTLLHADFYRVNMDRRIQVTVPLIFKGEPRGVKLQGGVLDTVHREIELETLPADIPDSIEIDVANLNLGDSIHLRDLTLNPNWVLVSEPELMLVHVISPRAAEEPAAAEATAVAAAPGAAAEPEVIKKGKTEKDEADAKKDKKDKK
jgi:large subunit ribosomal protein L25